MAWGSRESAATPGDVANPFLGMVRVPAYGG